MKKILFSMLVLLSIAASSAHADSHEFDDVPPGSWPYSALAQLVKSGEVDGMKPPFVAKTMIRYEFGVLLARWMDRHEQDGSFDKLDKSTKDIVCALGYEFASEIGNIQGRGPIEVNPLESKVQTTPASEWLDVWRGTPVGEHRILAPQRSRIPASFLRRLGYGPRFPSSVPLYKRGEATNPFTVSPDGHD